MRKLWKLISPSTPADKGSAPTTPRIRSFHPHSHTHTMAHFIDARAQTHALCTLGLLAITLGRSDDSSRLYRGFIKRLWPMRSVVDHLCNISPEGDVVKKKKWDRPGKDAGRYISDISGIYILVTRERRDENGRPNSRKRCFETPKTVSTSLLRGNTL